MNGQNEIIQGEKHKPTPLLPQTFFARSALEVAPELIGCELHMSSSDRQSVAGLIVETEAYLQDDPASHSFRGCRPRNAMMFGDAGYSYVYLIYGMYHCLNVVTGLKGQGEAVLIRAVDFSNEQKNVRIGAGPGKLCRYLNVTLKHNGLAFFENNSHLRITQRQIDPPALVQTTRIGISQAKDLLWRWYWRDHPSVSKK